MRNQASRREDGATDFWAVSISLFIERTRRPAGQQGAASKCECRYEFAHGLARLLHIPCTFVIFLAKLSTRARTRA